jgi:hypothetical protein
MCVSAFTLKIVVILKLFAITINLPLKLDFIEDIKIKSSGIMRFYLK